MMFDFVEYYDRIATELSDNSICVEIGVANGDSALHLAKRMRQIGKNDFTLYMVDNMDYGGYDQLVTIYENIITAKLTNHNIKVVPTDSISASKMFNNDSIDFIFLDSSHEYKETKDSIKAWYPKLKDDGILAGHDYFLYKDDVGRAVDELLPSVITREPINKPDQHQTFEPEQFLFIEDTANHYGLWWCQKRFYYAIR